MIASVVEPTTALAALAGDLLLARLLLPTKRPPSPKRIRDEVGRFFRERPSDERWQDTIDGLVNAGLITTKPQGLTAAGRTRALDFLGVSELPPRSTWATIQAKFLLPKALGLAPTDQETVKKIGKADYLAPYLLKRFFKLSDEVPATLSRVFDALVCRELGLPEATPFTQVRALILSRLIGSEERLGADDLKKKAPRLLLGAKKAGAAGLRETVLVGWADGAAPRPAAVQQFEPRPVAPTADEPEPAEFDLPAFAMTVKAAARDCPTGRFGDNKVFIAHVWRRLGDEPSFPAMDLPTFKQRLTEANNAGLLTLSRADLVQVMDLTDINESHTEYLNAEFHFVLVEKELP
jgi:hypothetical protein